MRNSPLQSRSNPYQNPLRDCSNVFQSFRRSLSCHGFNHDRRRFPDERKSMARSGNFTAREYNV